MIRKPLTCPTCGDTWKRVFNENFLRLGPPTHECRACWTTFPSEAKEWVDLDWSGRLGYFLQDIVILAPLALLLIVAIAAAYFLNLVDPWDAQEFLWAGVLALLGMYALLTLWSLLMVMLSWRRARRPAAVPVAEGPDPASERHLHYPQGRPNPRSQDPEEQRGRPL